MKIIHNLIRREVKNLNVLSSKLTWKERRNIRGKLKHFGVNLKGCYFVMRHISGRNIGGYFNNRIYLKFGVFLYIKKKGTKLVNKWQIEQ